MNKSIAQSCWQPLHSNCFDTLDLQIINFSQPALRAPPWVPVEECG